MPSHTVAPHTTKLKLPQRKLIKKEPKNATPHCTNTPSDCDLLEENTMSETTQPQTQFQSVHNLQRVTRLVKFATLRFKYSIDTYLVCLSILNSIKLDIPQKKLKLIAAAVLLIAGKVHEFRTPKFLDLLKWGEYEFKSCDLVASEAQILTLLDFRVPVAFKCCNVKAIEQEVEKLESKIHTQNLLFQ